MLKHKEITSTKLTKLSCIWNLVFSTSFVVYGGFVLHERVSLWKILVYQSYKGCISFGNRTDSTEQKKQAQSEQVGKWYEHWVSSLIPRSHSQIQFPAFNTTVKGSGGALTAKAMCIIIISHIQTLPCFSHKRSLSLSPRLFPVFQCTAFST